jgi:hypothetical protein
VYILLPVIGFTLLKKKSLESLEVNNKEAIFLFVVLFSVTIIAIGIVDNESLFMSNGTRVYSRLQYAIDGLVSQGVIPIYNPGIGQGEATFLWDSPSRAAHFIIPNFMLKFFPGILFFNAYSFFILFISVLALGILFDSILNKEKSMSNTLAISAVTVSIGLSFHFLQLLESLKQFTALPLAYLLLSIVIGNPKTFREYLILAYSLLIIMTIHPGYGFGVIAIAIFTFILMKSYYIKNNEEIKQFMNWTIKSKFLILFTLLTLILLPIFFFSGGAIYGDFLAQSNIKIDWSPNAIKTGVMNFFTDFFTDDINILSLRYPDVRRIDDQVIGGFISVFGILSLALLLVLYKLKDIKNFRAFVYGYVLYLIFFAIFSSKLFFLSGAIRTTKPYLIIILGASILCFICLFKKKSIKFALIALVFIAFIHTIPFATQNITNIHREMYMSGNVYQNEMEFVKQLPIDGRIMNYGVFNNVIDFGSNLITGRYFSREEREELLYHGRTIYFKRVHSSHSFGDPDLVPTKSGMELSNFFRLGGFKYLFLNVCHPMGSLVASKIYPDFSYPIYQNDCMVFLIVNNTNYVEKVDLAKNVDDEVYKQEDGYKYTTIGNFHDFNLESIEFTNNPKKPQPLEFKRLSPTKVNVFGEFNDNEWVLFKEIYWPRWKAFIDGKELQIFADNHEQILIKTIKGNTINLEYSVLPIEKIFGVLSIIGFLSFSTFILFLLRK